MPIHSKVRWWLLVLCLSAVVVCLDYVTPWQVQFPIVLLVPTLLATWYIGILPGIAFAVLLPAVRLSAALGVFHERELTPLLGSVNFGIRVTAFLLFVFLTHKVKTLQGALEQRVDVHATEQ